MKIEKGMIFRSGSEEGFKIEILKVNPVQIVYKIIGTNKVYAVGRSAFEKCDLIEIGGGEDGN